MVTAGRAHARHIRGPVLDTRRRPRESKKPKRSAVGDEGSHGAARACPHEPDSDGRVAEESVVLNSGHGRHPSGVRRSGTLRGPIESGAGPPAADLGRTRDPGTPDLAGGPHSDSRTLLPEPMDLRGAGRGAPKVSSGVNAQLSEEIGSYPSAPDLGFSGEPNQAPSRKSKGHGRRRGHGQFRMPRVVSIV